MLLLSSLVMFIIISPPPPQDIADQFDVSINHHPMEEDENPSKDTRPITAPTMLELMDDP